MKKHTIWTGYCTFIAFGNRKRSHYKLFMWSTNFLSVAIKDRLINSIELGAVISQTKYNQQKHSTNSFTHAIYNVKLNVMMESAHRWNSIFSYETKKINTIELVLCEITLALSHHNFIQFHFIIIWCKNAECL